MRRLFFSCGLLCLLAIGHSHAAVPGRMNYQGKLTDSLGNLVADGSYDMIFSICDASSGGTAEWSEEWKDSGAIAVTGGLFSVLLGAHTPIDLPFDEAYWLQLQVKYGGSYETLLPRQQIASAGYAFRAEKVSDGAVGTAALADSAVTSGKVADGSLTNEDISGSAAISWSKSNCRRSRLFIAA